MILTLDTYSNEESGARGRHPSVGDTRRYSSQESVASEEVRERVTFSEPRMVEVCPAMRKLTMESKHRAMSESSIAVSSGEDER